MGNSLRISPFNQGNWAFLNRSTEIYKAFLKSVSHTVSLLFLSLSLTLLFFFLYRYESDRVPVIIKKR